MKASEILHSLDMTLGTASAADVRLAYRLADDDGTIQAGDMVRLMGYADPTRHTTCSLRTALRWLGCKDATDSPTRRQSADDYDVCR